MSLYGPQPYYGQQEPGSEPMQGLHFASPSTPTGSAEMSAQHRADPMPVIVMNQNALADIMARQTELRELGLHELLHPVGTILLCRTGNGFVSVRIEENGLYSLHHGLPGLDSRIPEAPNTSTTPPPQHAVPPPPHENLNTTQQLRDLIIRERRDLLGPHLPWRAASHAQQQQQQQQQLPLPPAPAATQLPEPYDPIAHVPQPEAREEGAQPQQQHVTANPSLPNLAPPNILTAPAPAPLTRPAVERMCDMYASTHAILTQFMETNLGDQLRERITGEAGVAGTGHLPAPQGLGGASTPHPPTATLTGMGYSPEGLGAMPTRMPHNHVHAGSMPAMAPFTSADHARPFTMADPLAAGPSYHAPHHSRKPDVKRLEAIPKFRHAPGKVKASEALKWWNTHFTLGIKLAFGCMGEGDSWVTQLPANWAEHTHNIFYTDWWATYIAPTASHMSMADFLAIFTVTYASFAEDERSAILRDLANGRYAQGSRPFSQYAQVMTFVFSKLPHMHELDRIGWFTNNMQPSLRAKCMMDSIGKPFTSLAALMAHANLKDAEMRFEQEFRTIRPSPSPSPHHSSARHNHKGFTKGFKRPFTPSQRTPNAVAAPVAAMKRARTGGPSHGHSHGQGQGGVNKSQIMKHDHWLTDPNGTPSDIKIEGRNAREMWVIRMLGLCGACLTSVGSFGDAMRTHNSKCNHEVVSWNGKWKEWCERAIAKRASLGCPLTPAQITALDVNNPPK